VPSVQTRSLVSIQFLVPGGTAVETGCVVPQWTLTTPTLCQSTLTLVLPWSSALACGFSQVGTGGIGSATYAIWAATVVLNAQETVYTGRTNVTQTFSNTYNIDVTFANYATVSTNINVAAAVLVTAAIVNQQYNTQIQGEGTVTFVSQVGYPYQLDLTSPNTPIDIFPSSIETTDLTSVTSVPAVASGSFTMQTFLLAITPGPNTCTLNGIYIAAVGRFTLQCTQAAITNGQCPEILNPDVGITLNISSSSFCGQVLANVSAVLSINSYNDAAFTEPASSFLVQPKGEVYFQVTVVSSPQVTVTALAVSSVQISSAYIGAQTLYQNGITTAGINFGFSLASSSGVTTAFSIELVSFFNVPLNIEAPVTFEVVVAITYESGAKKRFIEKRTVQYTLQGEQSSTASTPSHVVTAIQVTGSSSFASSLHSSFVVTAMAVLVACVGFF